LQKGKSPPETGAGEKSERPPNELTVDLGGGVKMELVLMPAGSFLMGEKTEWGWGEEPVHKVRITKPFYLGKYEVTQDQWQAVTGSNPSKFKGPKNPVEQVSWHDCQTFLDKLSEKQRIAGVKFGLPTEAHWEYACRAGSTTRFCFGDDEKGLGDYAWHDDGKSALQQAAGAVAQRLPPKLVKSEMPEKPTAQAAAIQTAVAALKREMIAPDKYPVVNASEEKDKWVVDFAVAEPGPPGTNYVTVWVSKVDGSTKVFRDE
jgi:hypothetical protein